MNAPRRAQDAPYLKDLPAGDYRWCACGLSKDQPFCDGSHKGTAFLPVKFTLDRAQTVWLCGCKHSRDQPFCDGTHNTLPKEPQP